MPSLGMYTTEGTITEWLRPPGSQVEAGQPVVEVTTEKATYQVESPAAGIFHATAQIGAVIPDQGLIGYILAAGEAPPEPESAPLPPGVPGAAASPAASGGVPQPTSTFNPSQGGEVRATPVARRLAREHGIDITTIAGTGPGGRIVEADVVAAAARGTGSPAGAAPSPTVGAPAESGPATAAHAVRQRIPLIGMRKVIADRLRGSLLTTAPVTLTREVDAEALVAARERLKPGFAAGLPYDALFVKAVAAALAERGELNATIESDAILLLSEIHVGVAVAVSGGLLVPVVRDADKRSLADVAGQIVALSERAKAGTLKPEEMAGGTFTITNLGGYGVDAFTPIVNPPQAAILGIGRILPRAVVRDGQLVARRTCVLSLTFDHRVADGAPAAQLLDAIARNLTNETFLAALA
jgi:pyruvate dehydrogenase E2 component (dihydrolipoamide acetyltransferase)